MQFAAAILCFNDLGPFYECDNNRVGKDRIRLLKVVLDLADMGRDLWALEAAQVTVFVAPNAINRSELPKFGCAGCKGQNLMRRALLSSDRWKDQDVRRRLLHCCSPLAGCRSALCKC